MTKHKYPQDFKVIKMPKGSDELGEYRYGLVINRIGREIESQKVLVCLMMNPSVADCDNSDQTINMILNHYMDEYDRLIVFNSFPLRNPDSKMTMADISRLDDSIIKHAEEKNTEAITSLITTYIKTDASVTVLVGSGNLSGKIRKSYVAAMNTITSELPNAEKKVVAYTKKHYGRHPGRGAISEALIPITSHDENWHVYVS